MEIADRYEVLGIEQCTRCGKTGPEDEEYGVRGIARIGGNLCVECVRELDPDVDPGKPVAVAYDAAGDGALIAKLHTREIAAEVAGAWWTRVEYLRDDQDEACPECGEETAFYPNAGPGAYWCEVCEREFWEEGSGWYSCGVDGEPRAVEDGGRDA